MRVLQLHAHYRERGGEDNVVESDRQILRDAGHVVEQHTEMNPTEPLPSMVSLAASAWNLAAQRRVRSVVDRFQPDVVHVHNTWFALSPAVLEPVHKRRIPTVMTMHNFRLGCANSLLMRSGRPCEDCLHRGTHHAVVHRCYRGSRTLSSVAAAGIALHQGLGTWPRLVDRFVVLSHFAASRLVLAGVPRDKMVIGANFAADPGPRPSPPSRSRSVLFIGRLSEEKGLHVLLRAWAAAVPDSLELHVLGDGPRRTELEALAPPGVHFHGRAPSSVVLSRLAEARAVVIPSTWYEGQPLVALEALAAGVPLVLSDVGGLPEVFGDTDSGWLVPPGDEAELAARLGALEESSIIDRKGSSARLRYEARFTAESAVERLELTYEEASRAARPW